ncbi:hypothetical protein [Promicromonospora sp. NFX87]|uniref:hypothetical protein n=1 Tax=Promicromonospora sp. NFX87 TaxID=3402691 RepID=UPI003AFA7F2D
MARSEKSEREQVRRHLQATGLSVAQIAVEMGRRFGERPRTAWRFALGWEQWRAVQAYRTANPTARIDETRLSKWERWPHGGSRPSLENLAGLALAFGHGCTPRDLVDDHDRGSLSAAELAVIDPQPPVAELAPSDDTAGLRAMATEAARSSSAFADLFSSQGLSDDVLEQFGFRLSRIATDYVHAPLRPLFTELIAVRDEIFTLLNERPNPRLSSDLFFLAGSACLLLAHASQNLGELKSSVTQIRAARLFAEHAGHTGLQAWTAGTAALITEWSPQSRMTLRLTQQAAALAPQGESRIRIAAIEARAAAKIGDNARARAALDQFHAARDETPVNDEVVQFGGLLTFPAAKQDYYLGGTYTLLGEYEAARRHSTAAITAYRTGPVEERSYGDEALAHIDLLTIGILHDRVDDVEHALRHVLDLPPQMRIRQLGSAMDRVRSLMHRPEHEKNPAIKQLAELINDYDVIDGTEGPERR